jgi:DNA-binding beta-propeller fold protein YncE
MQRSAHRLWVGGITVITALALAGGAMAQTGPGSSEPAATDNKRLSGEPASTQAMFGTVWGSQAAAEWVKEHNAAISGQAPAPAAAPPAAPAAAAPAPTTVPPIAADTTQQTLTKVPIPPIQGKTASIDILEIDQAAHVLYVTDRTDNGIDEFDVSTPTARYLRTVDVGSGANGVSVAKNVNEVFAGLNNSDVVAIDINPTSPTVNTVVARVNTGGKMRADEMDYDAKDKKLYVANSDDGIVSVIDASTNQIIKKFDNLGEALEQPRYNSGDGMMYMSGSGQNVIFKFDPTTDTMVAKMDVVDKCNPNGLGINPTTNQAVLGCSNRAQPQHAVSFDLATGKVISTFTQVGAGDAVFYSAKIDRFFFGASNFVHGPQIGILGGTPIRFITNVPSAVGSHGVAFDETNNIVYSQDQAPNDGALISFPLPQ